MKLFLSALAAVFLIQNAASGQTCPPVTFFHSAEASMASKSPRQGSGLQRMADGAFIKRTYSGTSVANLTQQAPVPNAQDQFLSCLGLPPRGARQSLPAGWKLGGDPLIGRGGTHVAGGDLLNNGTLIGLCTGFCGVPNSGQKLVTGQLDANLNLISQASYGIGGASGVSVIAADLNNDGKRDAVLASASGQQQGAVSVYLLAANGAFSGPVNYNVPAFPHMAAAYDVNNDGKLDIILATDTGYSVLLGNGDGTLQSAVSTTVGSAGNTSLVVADVNGDGKGDIILGSTDVIHVLLGNGNGTFQASRDVSLHGSFVYVVAGDVNKDGQVDLVASDTIGTIAILLGDGTGNFTLGSRYVTTGENDSLFLTDFDLDGNVDIVSAIGHPDALAPSLDSSALIRVLFGKGDGTFYGIRAYAAGKGDTGAVIADFNNDGKLDWARYVRFSSTISLFLGQGGANFAPAPTITIPDAFDILAIAAGDFNGDGKLDLVAAANNSNLLYLLLGKGDGTFQTATSFTAKSGVSRIAAGDFNGDGKADLVYTDSDGKVYVQLGNGAGGFSGPVGYAGGVAPGGVTVVDLNGDGKLDLVVTLGGDGTANSAGAAIFIGKGDGTFNAATTYMTGGSVAATTVGDVNGDGKPDILVSTGASGGATNNVTVLLNQGNGTFSAQQPLSTSFRPQEIAIADFTGDGKPDLLVSHCCGSVNLTLMAGNGDGTFQPETAILSGSQYSPRAVDLNNDGKPDVMFTYGSFDGGLGVLINAAGSDSSSTSVTGPAPGSKLTGSTVTFSWGAVANATKYKLTIGSTSGGSDIFSQETTATSLQVSNLPTDGRTLYVSIAAFVNGSYGTSNTATFLAQGGSGSGALRFVAVTPCRIADTRNATSPFGGPVLAGGSSRSFTVPSSSCNIPASAQAYSLNVTVVPQGSLGYLTIWPTGQAQPNVSTLNSPDGRVKANAAIVPAGSGGAVSVFVTDPTHVILDINGYFEPAGASASGTQFYPVTPCRISDTRNATGPLGGPTLTGGTSRTIPVGSACGVPAGAQAYSLNFTVVPKEPLGFLTTWPTGQPRPEVSTLNAPTGAITANAAIVPAGSNGSIDIFALNTTEVVIDINGYFGAPGANGVSLYTVAPCRISDTRNQAGDFGGPTMAGGSTRNWQVPASACGIPATAKAYTLNATVVPAEPLGFLTLWPTGGAQPNVSTLNSLDKSITSNAALVPAGANGAISAYVTNTTDLILDISGYFAP